MDLKELIAISRLYGEGTDFVIAGGGNTSVKDGERMAVKASGAALRGITEAGFVELSRKAVRQILTRDYGDEPLEREARIKADLLASRTAPEKGGRPSVEASLHESIGYRYVVHTHPFLVNALICAKNGEAEAERLFGDDALYLRYCDPGYTLAKRLEDELLKYRAAHGADPHVVLMENHGLVVAADTTAEIRTITEDVCARIRKYLRAPLPSVEKGTVVPPVLTQVLPGLRMMLSEGGTAKVAAARSSDLIAHFLESANSEKVSLPLLPDDIVYCKSAPLAIGRGGKAGKKPGGDPEALLAEFPRALEVYRKKWGYPPKVVLAEGIGLIGVEDSKRSVETVLDVFEDLMKVSFLSESFGGPRFLSPKDISFIDAWEVENYRRSVAASAVGGVSSASAVGAARRRMEGRIAVVTGAAQGFGKGIAEGLFREGANVVIADLNEKAGRALAAELNSGSPANGAVFAPVDVTNPGSVQALALETVKAFGGIDLLISNAGVLRAGSLEELSEETFDFVTRVNYTGYFVCVKHFAPVMKLQHRFAPGRLTDIVQVNSKSGLEGSNRNSAYAGSKFGSIGLTQSFAKELVEYGIKVNSVCPGNFFEGPLWSDPETGLFVQYLRTGKVPGAKSIADVKKFYESRVPMGRGARIEDVLRAILYLVEQEYETGQALPVTGGQVMLA